MNTYKIVADGFLRDHTLATCASVGMVSNAISRIIWSTLQDRFGFKKIYICLLTLQLFSGLALWSVRD